VSDDRRLTGPEATRVLLDGLRDVGKREAERLQRIAEMVVNEPGRRPLPGPGPDDAPAQEVTKSGPIATPDQAIEAYERLQSDRAGARELGLSRTHFRRLRGVQD
jgi:hypothetical protein